MTNIITSIGWFGFLASAVYFIVYDRMSETTNVNYIMNTRNFLFASAGLVILGYVLKYTSTTLKLGSGRCRKCGKRIDKGEMFCFDHRREAIWQAKEKERFDRLK